MRMIYRNGMNVYNKFICLK